MMDAVSGLLILILIYVAGKKKISKTVFLLRRPKQFWVSFFMAVQEMTYNKISCTETVDLNFKNKDGY